MWLTDFPVETTVVYAFSVTRDGQKLVKKLQKHADTYKHDLWCVTYGAGLPGREPVRTLHAHSLYFFEPQTLQEQEA
jgi:hypothetical protein